MPSNDPNYARRWRATHQVVRIEEARPQIEPIERFREGDLIIEFRHRPRVIERIIRSAKTGRLLSHEVDVLHGPGGAPSAEDRARTRHRLRALEQSA